MFIFSVRSCRDLPRSSDPCRAPFDLYAGRPLTVLVEFSAEKDCPPGDARIVIDAKNMDGEIIGTYEVRVQIWRFALLDAPSCETAVGLLKDQILPILPQKASHREMPFLHAPLMYPSPDLFSKNPDPPLTRRRN